MSSVTALNPGAGGDLVIDEDITGSPPVATTTSGGGTVSASPFTLAVSSAAGFPLPDTRPGVLAGTNTVVWLWSNNANKYIAVQYEGISGNTLTGCTVDKITLASGPSFSAPTWASGAVVVLARVKLARSFLSVNDPDNGPYDVGPNTPLPVWLTDGDGNYPGVNTGSLDPVPGKDALVVAVKKSNADHSALGELVGGKRTNQIEIDFYGTPDAALITNATTGSGSVTQANGHTLYAAGTAITGLAKGTSVSSVVYRPGNETYAYFTAAFSSPQVVGENGQRIGLYDDVNGFYVGYEQADFGVTKRTNGFDTFIPRSSWNGDKLDGSGGSKFTRDGAIEPITLTYSNLFRIRFAWLGSASIYFEVFSPDGVWVTFHTIRQPNSELNPSLTVPNLPMRVEVMKKNSTTTNVVLYTACWAAGTTTDVAKIDSTLTSNSLAALTRSVIAGKSTAGGTSYVNVKVTPSGALATQLGDISGVVGQNTMANSLPVAIASDQSPFATVLRSGPKGTTAGAYVTSTASGGSHQPLDVTLYDTSGNPIGTSANPVQVATASVSGTGTICSVLGDYIEVATENFATVAFSLSAGVGFESAVYVYASVDGTNFFQVTSFYRVNNEAGAGGVYVSSASAVGLYVVNVSGYTKIRIGLTDEIIFGPATVAYEASTTPFWSNTRTAITNGTQDATVKAGGAAPGTEDGSLVVSVSPNLPTALQGQKTMAASLPVTLSSDQSAVPVSGTVTANAGTGTFAVSAASLPLPTGAATAAKQPALGIAGTASSDVITVQGIASMTALKVDGSATTQPVSGTVTANAGTGTFAVSAASLPLPTGAATAAKQPTLGTPGTAAADVLSIQGVSGMVALKVDASSYTQPITGTITAIQSTAANLNTTAAQGSAANLGGAWPVKITDGTNTLPTMDAVNRAGFQKITDGANFVAVKAASTPPTVLDPSLVVSISPNSSLTAVNPSVGTTGASAPTSATEIAGPNETGSLLAPRVRSASSQATATDPSLVVAVSPNTPAKIWDGTSTVAVKAASTAAVATDPALVVAISPNNPVTTSVAKAGTATVPSPVASILTTATLLASNTSRLGATIFNDSTANLYVKFGTAASTSDFTVKLPPGAYYEVPFLYTGVLTGTWDAINGNARMTELTA